MVRKARNNKKKIKRRNRRVSRPRVLSLGPTFPNGIIAKHKYTDQLVLSGTYTQSDIPATALQSIRTASLFDPDRTNVGHQPLFYDEMALVYNQYRVLGAKMRIRFVNLCEEPIIAVGAHLGAPLGTGWNPHHLMERKDVKTQILSPMSAGGKNQTSMTLFYSPSKFYKQTKSNLRADNDLVGKEDGSVVPSKMTYFEFGVSQVDSAAGGSADHKVKVYIDIEYTAFWNDRKLKLTPS
jgi:hypothetical protein